MTLERRTKRVVESAAKRPRTSSRQRLAAGQVVKQVYKITYPTGKIYIGKDSFGSARYMGSPDPNLVNSDFANLPSEMRRDYMLRKDILWESESASEEELSAREVEMVCKHRSNDPGIGYNRWPKFKPE